MKTDKQCSIESTTESSFSSLRNIRDAMKTEAQDWTATWMRMFCIQGASHGILPLVKVVAQLRVCFKCVETKTV